MLLFQDRTLLRRAIQCNSRFNRTLFNFRLKNTCIINRPAFQMHFIHQMRNIIVHNTFWKQSIVCTVAINARKCKSIKRNTFKSFSTSKWLRAQGNVPKPLRDKKPKARNDAEKSIVDLKLVRKLNHFPSICM